MASALFFSRDPGPTNFLVAVYEELLEADRTSPGLAVLARDLMKIGGPGVVIARGPAQDIWRKAGYKPLPAEFTCNVDVGCVLLRRHEAGLLVTGASDIDEDGDRILWRSARRLGIPSHAVLDHPASIPNRFRLSDGTSSWPDYVYAPDNQIADAIVSAGGDPTRVHVIGWIHHDRLKRIAENTSSERVGRLRSSWGARPEDTVVLFASECAAEMSAAGRPSPYDEFETLGLLLRRVAAGSPLAGLPLHSDEVTIVIRPHPRDRVGKYDSYTRRSTTTARIVVSAEEAPEIALLAADAVVGMNSSLLYEAVALGRPVESLVGADLSRTPRALT